MTFAKASLTLLFASLLLLIYYYLFITMEKRLEKRRIARKMQLLPFADAPNIGKYILIYPCLILTLSSESTSERFIF